jgi:hypothetical protein
VAFGTVTLPCWTDSENAHSIIRSSGSEATVNLNLNLRNRFPLHGKRVGLRGHNPTRSSRYPRSVALPIPRGGSCPGVLKSSEPDGRRPHVRKTRGQDAYRGIVVYLDKGRVPLL